MSYFALKWINRNVCALNILFWNFDVGKNICFTMPS